ncbi:glycosyltransferase [Myxococcota bacterium]|nr:glycosyltransferase [Myxococcota bacterium]
MLANVRALAAAHEVSLISLGDAPVPGLRHRTVALTEDGWLRRALEFQTRVARIVDHYDFDGFHVRSPFEGLAVPSERPIVYEVNALYSLELAARYPGDPQALRALERVHVMERCLLDRASRIVTPSRVTAELLGGLGVERARIDVVPNTASVPVGADGAGLHRPRVITDDVRLVYAGSLAPWQGVAELLLALHRWPHFTLTIITGDRDGGRSLLALASALGIRERVELRAAVPVEELGELLAAHDVGVAPLLACDRNVLQGCHPVKVLDYAAVGLPILAPALPVVRELVGDEYPLYDPYSYDGPIEVLRALRGDVSLRAALGASLRRRVADEYSPERYSARVLDVWARVGGAA